MQKKREIKKSEMKGGKDEGLTRKGRKGEREIKRIIN